MGRFGRVLLVGLVLVVVSGCGAVESATAPSCGPNSAIHSCVSPDHLWAVHTSGRSRDVLVLTRMAPKKTFARQVLVGCCGDVTWAEPHVLLFIDGENENLVSVNPPSQRRTLRAGVTSFALSPNSRWIVALSYAGRLNHSRTVEVLPVKGGTCRRVLLQNRFNTTGVSFSTDSKSVVVYWEEFNPSRRPAHLLNASQTPIAALHLRCGTPG